MIISSTAILQDDPWFGNTKLLVTSANQEGVTAFIINKPFDRRFNELQEFRNYPPITLYTGGPVQNDHLFFLHTHPDTVPGSGFVWGNIYCGGDFGTALESISNGTIPPHDIRLFLGYTGWDVDQLKDEFAEGCWTIESGSPDFLFNFYQ